MTLDYKLYKELGSSYLNDIKDSFKNLKYKHLIPLIAASAFSLYNCGGGNGNGNNGTCCEPTNNPPIVNVINPASVYETGNQITYQAVVSDPDGDSVDVSLEVEKSQDGNTFTIDDINSGSMDNNPPGSDNWEKTDVSFNDGYIVRAKVRATDGSLETIKDYNDLNVYISEEDAQLIIQNTILNNVTNNPNFKTKPITNNYDFNETLPGFIDKRIDDAILRFIPAATNSGVAYDINNDGIVNEDCTQERVFIGYIALNDEETQSSWTERLNNFLNPLYDNCSQPIGEIDFLYLIYEDSSNWLTGDFYTKPFDNTYETPITKQDLEYYIAEYLIGTYFGYNIDGLINYKPVADDGINPGTHPNDIILDGCNSTDDDGSIIQYDWFFDDGINPIELLDRPCGGFGITLSDGCYNVTLKVTDDDGTTDSDTTQIEVNLGICP